MMQQPPQAPSADGSVEFMRYREDLAAQTAAEELRARVQQRRAVQQPQAPQAPQAQPAPAERGVLETAGAVASDVGRGVTEIPRAIGAGVRDAVQETVNLFGDVGNWFENTVKTGGIKVSRKGVEFVSFEELQDLRKKGKDLFTAAELPEIADPESTTGKALKGVSQFLAGFGAAGKVLKALKPATTTAKVGKAAAQGAVADFTVFDPQEERLSNLLQEVPELQNPVTEFLAADSTDTNAEGRFKNAIEGLGLGVATDGFLLGLKTLRQARAAKRTQEEAAKVAKAAKVEVPATVSERELAVLGSDKPDAPLVGVAKRGQTPEAPALDEATGLPLNSDGTVTVYHHTSAEAAENIKKTGKLKSAGEPSVYVTTRRETDTGYGDVAVEVKVNPKLLTLDDEFPDGRRDFSIPVKGPGGSLNIGLAQPEQLKTARAAKATAEVKPEDIMIVDEGVPGAAVPRGTKAGEVYVNFARINAPEDVQTVLQTMADKFKPDVDKARRGVRTFEQIELDAAQVNAWEALQARRTGEPLSAEQSVAARQLWAMSGDKLAQVAREASANPSEANLFAFRKMLATHYAVQNEVLAARAETARALASWRIPAGGSAEQLRAITDAINNTGGEKLTREMADRVSRLVNAGEYEALDSFIQRSTWARTSEAMQEAWIMGLLSGPKTHLVNMMSNTAVIFAQMYERGVAAQVNQLVGVGPGVEVGEATAQMFGIVQSMKDALRYSARAFRTMETGYGVGKIELPREGAISSEAFNISSETFLGRAVDGLGNVIRLPGRALAAEDEFFKTIGYRMELNAQALRQATSEMNAGMFGPDELKGRIQDIIDNPPENIRLAAVDAATYQTFTNTPGNLAKGLQEIVARYPGLKVLLPFVRTPANILRYTFERTPLAPLMSQVRADIAAGGARSDLAYARMTTGSMLMLAAADLAMNGSITGGGPSDPKEKAALMRSGWQPYSVKIDDRWYAYNRLDPPGSLFGMSADLVEVLINTDTEDPNYDAEEAAVAIAAAIGANVLNKTYLSGLADFFEAMGDPKRRAEGFAQRFAGSLIPAGVAEVARQVDPYNREVYSMLDAMKRRTPGLSEDLPVRRDIWGRPLEFKSGLGWAYDVFSPIYSKKEDPEPIDSEMLRLEAPVSMPSKRVVFDGVTVDLDRYPGVYSRYLELAGNELKHPAWRLGAKDYLNALVTGKHPMSQIYRIRSDGPDGGKADMIASVVSDYRKLARDQLLKEYPELRDEVRERKAEKQRLRLPVFQ